MISVTSEISAQRRHPGKKMPMAKKSKSNSSKRGKISPNNEIIHQRPGCRTALAQASRKRMTVTMFRTTNTLRVTICNTPMTYRNLQIFFVSSPFQDLFFFVGKEPIALLVDLVEDLVDPLLRHIGDLLIRLSAGNFIVEFVFGRALFCFVIRVEKIIGPVKKLVHPYTPVPTPAHLINKEKTRAGAG